MSLPTPFNLIDGERSEPSEELGGSVCDANDARPISLRLGAGSDQVNRALATAARVHETGVWADVPVHERADALEAIAKELDVLVDAVAEADARTTGAVIGTTKPMATLAGMTFRGAAAALREGVTLTSLPGTFGPVEVRRDPRGPAVVLAPWNAPAPIAAHKLASALAAGCPIILKPSEWAPHSCTLLVDAIEAADVLPRGTVGLLQGDKRVGGALVTDPRSASVSFTGGLVAGRAIGEACGRALKPVQLELGGNNPLVMLEDGDVQTVADGVVATLTSLNGQWCRALGRLILPKSKMGDVLGLVEQRLAELRLGHSMDPESQMGPLAHARHLATVREAVQGLVARGGTLHQVTRLPSLDGHFFPPTLVTGLAPDDAAEEIFGPVATVHPYETRDEALALANGTPFGLAAYVFGQDEDAALAFGRRIRAGSIKVNAAGLVGLHPAAPRPAWGLSGLGDEGTRDTLLFFCGGKVIGIGARREGGRT